MAIPLAGNNVVLLWVALTVLRVSPFIRDFNPKYYIAVGFDNAVFHR